MPAVRFSRDKRGYEYVYLVHTPTRRGKTGRTRVLYWYRTPPGLKLGRKPFDEEVRASLERQNPGVAFDWETIVNTPMPPPDMTEYWRERRRLEKLAKAERRAEEAAAAASVEPDSAQEPLAEPAALAQDDAAETAGEADAGAGLLAADSGGDDESAGAGADGVPEGTAGRKRRRRRGGRRRRGVDARVDGANADASEEESGTTAAADGGAEPPKATPDTSTSED